MKRRVDLPDLGLWGLLEAEFVANVSSPPTQLADMATTSLDRCLWRCSQCLYEWPARLAFRSRRRDPTGCPQCFRKRNRAPGPGESLADLDPVLAKQFRSNLSRPERGPDQLRPQSHDLCEWECDQGHLHPASVANRTNGRGCPDCSGQGRSSFECKVAMLVAAASGLKVELDHRLRLPARREDRFDLFLPDLSLLIDLDPAWSHAKPGSLKRDTAKTNAALRAGLRLERIRERGLPPLPVPGLTFYEAGPGLEPEDWAETVGCLLRSGGQAWSKLDPAQIVKALSEASNIWQEVVARPKVSALDKAPHLADEFLGNLTNPGRGLDRMPPGCNDVCAWRCSTPGCGREWKVPLHVRALSGHGCQKCSNQKVAIARSRPGPGQSLAEVNPDLAAKLIEVIGHPGWTASDLRPKSNKECLWSCPDPGCQHEWLASPGHRSGEGTGCPKCARKRSTEGRIRPKARQSLLDLYPAVAAELVEVVGHPGWIASDLRAGSTKACRWRCSRSDCSGTWEATPEQRTRRGASGMRCPDCYPRRKRAQR
jgi:hypothetical protein